MIWKIVDTLFTVWDGIPRETGFGTFYTKESADAFIESMDPIYREGYVTMAVEQSTSSEAEPAKKE